MRTNETAQKRSARPDHTYSEHTDMHTRVRMSQTRTRAGDTNRCIITGGSSGGKALKVTQSHKLTHSLPRSHNGDNKSILKERDEEKRTMDREKHCHMPGVCYYSNATLPLAHEFLPGWQE